MVDAVRIMKVGPLNQINVQQVTFPNFKIANKVILLLLMFAQSA